MNRLRRISKEIALFNKEPPNKYIYIDYNDDNITHLDVLMIGPRNSPYSRIFFLFTIDYPPEYPIKPPKVKFTSSFNKKIHPNIFPGGWICLSTLNTGDNSGWVPSINLGTLLMTIYSMFNQTMIKLDNTHDHEKSDKFFPGVFHDTFYIMTQLIINNNNNKLNSIMMDYIRKHKDWYIRKIQRLSKEHDGNALDNYYNKISRANFSSFLTTFQML